MPKPKDKIYEKPADGKTKSRSPFKDAGELEAEIITFINRFKATVVEQAYRMSDFFEMSSYNMIVRYYEINDYEVGIANLQHGKYRYKCSPSGTQSNFSHFEVSQKIGRKTHKFEIHHNLSVQSCHDESIFTTPDISIIKRRSVRYTTEYYDTKRVFSFVENKNMLSFCEVKQFTPYPELIFNFMGVVNELRTEILTNDAPEFVPIQIAPSLMISGKPNKPTTNIKRSLEERYCINIFFDLFHAGSRIFSKTQVDSIRAAGSLFVPGTVGIYDPELEETPF